jgi:nitrate/nitrite transport system substrate-binding protein
MLEQRRSGIGDLSPGLGAPFCFWGIVMTLKLGFLALLDAAPLLVAKERGFFAEQGLDVELHRQSSWATLRDKLVVGALDGAQMLAPMVLASTLGLGGLKEPLVAALALNLGGNSITLSGALARRMQETGSLAAAILGQGSKPTFGIVHPFSSHNYEMRLWLAAAGIEAERDVTLTVVPPAQMLSNLSAGLIDGYCVGEPWGHLAARSGLGRVAITSREIWAGRFEKVYAVRQDWADRHPDTHRAILRSLLLAARWCDLPENRAELAELLSRPSHVNAPLPLLRVLLESEDRPIFHQHAANFPWRSQGLWYLAQMRRWGQLDAPVDGFRLVDQVFRADLARLAFLDLGLPVPLVDSKIEGAHDAPWILDAASAPIAMRADRFFDRTIFDPAVPSAGASLTHSQTGAPA